MCIGTVLERYKIHAPFLRHNGFDKTDLLDNTYHTFVENCTRIRYSITSVVIRLAKLVMPALVISVRDIRRALVGIESSKWHRCHCGLRGTDTTDSHYNSICSLGIPGYMFAEFSNSVNGMQIGTI